MKSKITISVCAVLIFLVLAKKAFLQERDPFSNEIAAFLKKDAGTPVPKNSILFVGSSSFTKWTDIQSYFPGYPIINRGFGGSSLPDLILYANDIIFPYHPKQVLIYCGENDLAASDTVTGETVFYRFKSLFALIRKKMADADIVFISIKPSPSRAALKYKEETANDLIRKFISGQQQASFVDIYHKMLEPDGKPKAAIFLEDSLHMNSKGYVIWQKEIRPFLKK